MNRKWLRAGNRYGSFALSALLLLGVLVFAQDPPPQPPTSPNLDEQLQTRLEFQRAAKQADDAERIKIESRACAALALRLLGNIEIDKFNWSTAIEHYSESLAILDSVDGRFDLALAYMDDLRIGHSGIDPSRTLHRPSDFALRDQRGFGGAHAPGRDCSRSITGRLAQRGIGQPFLYCHRRSRIS